MRRLRESVTADVMVGREDYMMKKIVALLLTIMMLLVSVHALAERIDYSVYSTEELLSMIGEIKAELQSRANEYTEPTASDDFNFVSNGVECHIRGYKGTEQYVVIPDEIDGVPVTVIEQYAFDSAEIISVHLPKYLKTLESLAFHNCRSLHEINIPDGLETIGIGVFENAPLTGELSAGIRPFCRLRGLQRNETDGLSDSW